MRQWCVLEYLVCLKLQTQQKFNTRYSSWNNVFQKISHHFFVELSIPTHRDEPISFVNISLSNFNLIQRKKKVSSRFLLFYSTKSVHFTDYNQVNSRNVFHRIRRIFFVLLFHSFDAHFSLKRLFHQCTRQCDWISSHSSVVY